MLFKLSLRLSVALTLLAGILHAQTETGELRLTIADIAGLPVQAAAELVSEANHYQRKFAADADGRVLVKRLPFGMYRFQVTHPGFAANSNLIEIRSALPRDVKILLSPAPMQTSVTVNEQETLIDPHRAGTVYRIGGSQLEDRLSTTPGRSLAELVDMEPGWTFEANGILHPRASEYQVQYVMDGLPLTDNRSAAYVADLDVNNVQDMTVMTSGYPAEYGRKLGGIVEVETSRDTRHGFHGKAVASGGSFSTASGYAEGQYGWGTNTLTLNAEAATTDRYLDPPVLQNHTNHGTTADLMGHYERDLDDRNRIGLIFRREQSRFEVPNEATQQQAGQRQDRDSYETALQFSYQHIFSPNLLGDVRAMARDITTSFWSNPVSTPMIAAQDRSYREGYFKSDLSVHAGNSEFKFGAETDFAGLREALNYRITDPTQFDPDTPQIFGFRERAQDREQGAYAQDLIRYKNLTLSAGIRFDHYRLLVDQAAWSPRAGLAYYWPALDIVFRGSYDRVFQTPSFENLLVSSSPAVTSLSNQVLRLQVKPSKGNFYEAGFTKALFGKLRLNASLYHRDFSNYADDDLLLNTGVSFPISFKRTVIYGAEVKLEIPHWGPLSGFVSYSNSRGNGFLPVTGGLFLGDDAARAITSTTGVFPVTQDQRNTVRSRFRYQIAPRLWAALGGTYNSGLPIEFGGTYQDAAAAHVDPRILERVNFSDGRARPGFSLDASLGALLSKREKETTRFQIDASNLTDRLNLLNFASLFSGTALAPPRSINARLQFEF